MNEFINQLFTGFVNTTVFFSLVLIAVLALRPLVAHFFGARTTYLLWSLPVIWSLALLLETPRDITPTFIDGNLLSLGSLISSPVTQFQESVQTINWWWVAMEVTWLIVTLLLLLNLIRSYIKFSNQITRSSVVDTQKEHNAQYVNGLNSPMVWGILRPVVILPSDFEQRFSRVQKELILKHENVHLKRGDNVFNLVASITRILFWFNPVVHIAYHYFRLDQESSCDAKVIQSTNKTELLEYAKAMVDTHSLVNDHSRAPETVSSWVIKSTTFKRVNMLKKHLSFKRSYTAGVVLITALGIVGGAVAAQKDSTEVAVTFFSMSSTLEEEMINEEFVHNMARTAKQINLNDTAILDYYKTHNALRITYPSAESFQFSPYWTTDKSEGTPSRTKIRIFGHENITNGVGFTMEYNTYLDGQLKQSESKTFKAGEDAVFTVTGADGKHMSFHMLLTEH